MKRVLSILFIIIYSIPVFAAVVSDNDGAAFITKAEFDSLKNKFQTQIDYSNRTIDNKIEDAISNYIAGTSPSTETVINTICYDEEGILAPRANYADLAWVEGRMNVGFRILYQSGSTSVDRACGIRVTDWVGLDPTEFTELAVKNVDYTSGNAEWVGKIKTKQYMYTSSFDTIYNGDTEYAVNQSKYGSMYNGFFARSNVEFFTSNDNLAHLQYSPSSTGVSYGVFASAKLSRLTREILSTTEKNIICVPQSVSCGRFSNIDEIRDWCNDTNSSGHTTINTLNVLFSESSSTATTRYLGTAGSRKGTVESYNMDFHTNTNKTGAPAMQYKMPYFGFVKNATNYSKIWTSKYDTYVNDFYNKDRLSNLYTDNKGNRHLFISAGCPIVYLEKGDLLTIDLEFEDKTKNYDVWFKYGTFNNVNVNNDSKLVATGDIYYGSNKDTKATVGSQNKSIRVPSGKQKVTLEAKENAYIFLKWSIYGNSGAGGGRFMPPKNVRVKSN